LSDRIKNRRSKQRIDPLHFVSPATAGASRVSAPDDRRGGLHSAGSRLSNARTTSPIAAPGKTCHVTKLSLISTRSPSLLPSGTAAALKHDTHQIERASRISSDRKAPSLFVALLEGVPRVFGGDQGGAGKTPSGIPRSR